MDGRAALVLMLSAMAVLLVGVKSQQRTCYFGPPPEPDPDHPGDWMKQVMQKVRERCPGRRQPTSAGHATTGDETTPASQTTIGKKTTPIGHTTKAEKTTPAGHTTVREETTPIGGTIASCASSEPLGVGEAIPNGMITMSSDDSEDFGVALNGNDAWRPALDDAQPWIQLSLIEPLVVTGVITQGFAKVYTQSYSVAYRTLPESDWIYVDSSPDGIKMFDANDDDTTEVTNLFDVMVLALQVRIYPIVREIDIVLRFDLLVCYD